MEEVVGVEEADELAPGGFDAAVPARGRAEVLLAQHAHGVAVRPGKRGARVGGPVVHDDDLERPVALRQNALEGGAEERFAVVHRDDAAHEMRRGDHKLMVSSPSAFHHRTPSMSTAVDSVSVVIPARNGVRFLADAIASAFAQTHSPAEVIVVDNGSTDGTAELAVACGARCVQGPGRNVSEARNWGVGAASAAFVAFLDHDDVWYPHKLERQVRHLLARPGLGYVSARARVRMEPGSGPPAGLRGATDGAVLPGALGSTLVARHDALERVPFEATLEFADDVDWLLRARDAGVRGDELADVLAEYRIHGPSNSSSDRAAVDHELFGVLRGSLQRRGRGRPR